MKEINRKAFLKMGGLALLAPLGSRVLARPFTFFEPEDGRMLKRMVDANDKQVATILETKPFSQAQFGRRTSHQFAMLAAAYVSPGSVYYRKPAVATAMQQVISLLDSVQSADGTVNSSNLESPPDTAFLLESLTAGAVLLQPVTVAEMVPVKTGIRKFLVRSGEALVTGGVHTPNHRWVISAALARLNALYPDPRYVNRIDQWLAEGVYIDADGHYPERSGIYSFVEDNAFITMAHLLNRPNLLEPVGRNLRMLYYYMEPNGDLVTADSRRQDQYLRKSILGYYLPYRFMANRNNDSFFAGVTRLIENLPGFEEEVLQHSLAHYLENKVLQEELPPITVPPKDFEMLFSTSSLLRIRRNLTTATLFGGADQPIIIASGRSNSPNIFQYRKGAAVLEYLRLSTDFFSTGYFYSEGLEKTSGGYRLHKKMEVPYYQPLPADKIKPSGDYALTPSIDDRFWNKMDFGNRPVSNVKTLKLLVTLTEQKGKCDLHFEVTGLAGVPVTVELVFREGGTLTGVTPGADGNSFLEQGTGTYTYEKDSIRFGPGILQHKEIKDLEGERYSTHFGSLRTGGMHVYLTGLTPFDHHLSFE